MNAALNGLGIQLFGWFGQLSIELAALAVLVLVACHLLPIKSPALRHLLWVVVLLKPLVAVAISSPYTLFTPFTPLVPLVESSRDVLAFSPVEHPTVQVAASPTIATSSVPLTAVGWGVILWLVGAVLLIGRILIGYGIVWRLRQQAQVQHDGPLCDALQQARLALDCYPKVKVAISPSIGSPMALGILRPIIVFPADLVEKLRTDELTLILMHELAHVRRWDNLTLLLQRLVSAVLFFHPAVWMCGRMLRREAEQACDDLVVCATGRSEAYAHSLAHVAERAVYSNPLIRRIPTMNAFAAAESDLALRIRRTLGGGAHRMGMRARVLAAVLLCPLATVTLPSVSKVAAESSKQNILIAVDQDGNMKLNDKSVTFATLKEELQAKRQQLDNTTMIIIQSPERIYLSGNGRVTQAQLFQIMDIANQVGLVNQVIAHIATEPQPAKAKGAAKPRPDNRIWQAVGTGPEEWSEEEWSEELERQLIFAEEFRQRMPWREATDSWQEATNPDEWPDDLKARLYALKPVVPGISYDIATATSAELAIYDAARQHVRTVVLGHQSPGRYSILWDGQDDAGRELSNGMYFWRLQTDAEEEDERTLYRTIFVR